MLTQCQRPVAGFSFASRSAQVATPARCPPPRSARAAARARGWRRASAIRAAMRCRRAARREDPDLIGRLAELREQAVEATAKDLPTVFQEMGLVRAMMERTRGEALPDAGSPYFAHLRVREGDEERDYCLGRGTFVDLAAGVRLVDWRFAPAARGFFCDRGGEPD